jgi:hypothetical protein
MIKHIYYTTCMRRDSLYSLNEHTKTGGRMITAPSLERFTRRRPARPAA